MRRPTGPRRLHLQGFIIWKFWPYRPGSFLHNGLTLLLVRSWPSIELRVCIDLLGTINRGWVEFDAMTCADLQSLRSGDSFGARVCAVAIRFGARVCAVAIRLDKETAQW